MPNSNTSEQMGSMTATSDGVNVMPLLQAVSHFYMEGDAYAQTADQVFGAISESQFRTTARTTVSGNIYTICQGQIFVQPQTNDNSKVNLILRPFKQPVQGISIKYFI